MKLKKEDVSYMVSRGYTTDLLKKDRPFSIDEGSQKIGSYRFIAPVDSIAIEVKSARGVVYGLHLFSRVERSYRTIYDKERMWLPAIYGTIEDYRILYQTGKVIIVEGIFDRVVFKLCRPDYACFAKLNKSVSSKLVNFLIMYATDLHAAYDSDEAGDTAYGSLLKRCKRNLHVKRIRFPYKDPNDTLKKMGKEKLVEYLSEHFSFGIHALTD